MKISKLILFSSVALTSAILISGCGKKDQAPVTSESSQAQVTPSQTGEQSVSGKANTVSYTINKKEATKGNEKVTYPEIVGLEQKMGEKWNKILAPKFSSELDPTFTKDDKSEISYEVMTQTSDMISIVFKGYELRSGASSPIEFLSTYNIDLKSGKNKRLKDAVNVSQLAEKLYSGKGYKLREKSYEQQSKETRDEIFKNVKDFISSNYSSAKKLQSDLEKYDYDETSASNIEEARPGYSYYDDGKLVLCIDGLKNRPAYYEIIIE